MKPTEGSIEKVVEDAVRAQVQQMIVTSLESVDGLTARLVAGAMSAPVKERGAYREIPFIEQLCRDAVHDAAKEAAKEWIEENRPSLVAEVKRQLSAQKVGVATALVDSLGKAAGAGYTFTIQIGRPDADRG